MKQELTRLGAAFGCLSAALILTHSPVMAAQNTTLGTRATTSQANSPLTSNAGATWSTYTRTAQYPGAVTLPLQFIPLTSRQKLAVLVSVPADANGNPIPGQFPAILTQTAYRIDLGELLGGIVPQDTTLLIGGQDKYMIERGYITVAVDVLGSGMSSGEEQLLGAAEQAGYGETVKWITAQPWFNGNIGVAGTSYLAIASLLTAEQQNPALKAVFAEVPMGDPYRATVAPGGLLDANFISTWLTLTQNLSVANGAAETNYPQYAAQIAAATQQHVAAINDWYMPTVSKALANQPGYATDDGTFWSVRSTLEKAGKIKVPTFIIGGSNDIFQRDEPLLYEQLKNSVNTKLVILPGAHLEAILGAMTNNNNFVGTGAPDSETLLLQWFDQYLMGINTGAASVPNVTQYVEGYGQFGATRYATSTDWPHPQASPQRLYLHGDMSLSPSAPFFSEPTHSVSEPPAPTVTLSTTNNGTDFTAAATTNDASACSSSEVQWSLGIAGFAPLPCFSNDAQVEFAQGALTYTTAPYRSNTYINGPIEADIWMSATNAQAAISVRLDDVDLLGNATPISTGIMSAVHRAVDTTRSRYIGGVMMQPWHPFTLAAMQPIVPNQPMLVPVEIFPAAALIRTGHRLRVAITASDQVEGIWSTPAQAQANGNVSQILNDPAHPSSIVLPIVPASALP